MKRTTQARLDQLERKSPPDQVNIDEARAQLCAALERVIGEQHQVEPAELGGPHAELLAALERLG